MSKNLTREQVALLSFTGRDAFVAPPTGFVRVEGGYISSHLAYELVLAGKLDPQANADAIAREDYERNEGMVRRIERAADEQRAVEAAERARRNHEANELQRARDERERSAFAQYQASH